MTLKQVARLLTDMQDEEGVAWLCDMFDVRGVRNGTYNPDLPYACNCPVARLAQKLTGTPGDIWAAAGDIGLEQSDERYDCGAGAYGFMYAYDRRAWPELEA